ncbi:hypothetical protein [Streptomyces sp. TRM64462]|uniref:hypothetical protein n=1 Tax=Streptomyces sp. TRM64462 TaxID=2741726 RepID=UPI0015869175|nr:hypothetical protein [Streptomyces sp. TRM64462]
MAGVAVCPSCGEAEELRGEPFEGDIKVTCLRCDAQWTRGAQRCAGCGGPEIVHRPQAMTRHSRGTQLSIIGWRELPLCRSCDAEALEASIAQNVPVPSEYVAVCLFGRDDSRPRRATPRRPAPSPPSTPGDAPRQGRVAADQRKSSTEAPTGQRSPRAARPAAGAPLSRAKVKPAPSSVPTVRQAIAAFMAEASGTVDATALLLLGTHLGSYNRLTALDDTEAADRLTAWCDSHWSDRGSEAAQRALGTICRAVDFWGARGWLSSDPASGVR